MTRAPRAPAALPAATSSRGAAAGILVAGLVTTVAPLVYLTALREPFRLPKLASSESLALLSLMLLGGRLVEVVAGGRPGTRFALSLGTRWMLRLAAISALPMAAVASLGLVTSSHPAHVREALPSLLIALTVLVGWSLAVEPRRLRHLLDLSMIPAAILALVGILQFHDLWQPFAFDATMIDPRVRITSLAGNVGELAAYLVLPLLLAQARLWEGWHRRRTERSRIALWGTGGALCLYALLVTSTLTALVALVVATLVLWLVLIERKRRFAVVVAVVALVGAIALAAGPLRPRAAEKLASLRRGDVNDLLTGRLDGWRCGLYMAGQRPLVGVGLGAFSAEFAPAKLALIDRGVEFYVAQRTAIFGSAHNEAIDVAAEWGGLGLLALALSIVAVARAARRVLAARSDASARADGAVAAAGLASFAALALAFFPFRVPITGYQAILFFAWLLASAAATIDEGAPARATVAPHRRRLVTAAATLALLVVVVLHARRAADRMAASAVLQRIESSTALMLGAHRSVPAVVQENRRVLIELRLREPSEVAILTTLAAQYVLLERFAEALEWYERGLDLEPRPELYFGRGAMQLRLGDREAARASFDRAVKLSPPLLLEVPPGVL